MLKSVQSRLAVGTAALAAALSAQAAPIAYEFSGVLTGVQLSASTIFSGASVGDDFQVRLWLDDALPNLNSLANATSGQYGDGFTPASPNFVSSINAVLTVGSTTRAFVFGGESARHTLSVFDGALIYYSGGRQVEVEGVQFTANPVSANFGSSGSGFGSAYLRYWQESPTGSGLTGPTGLLPGTALPTSLDGIGGSNSRTDFGYFWGVPNEDGLQSYIGGQLTGAQVITNAAPNPVPQPWPQTPTGSGNPGETAANPLMPSEVVLDPWTGAPTFVFDAEIVDPTETLWIDPPVAVGYDYGLSSESETQTFMSMVIGTDVGDGLYEVSWYDEAAGQYMSAEVGVGEMVSFGDLGSYWFSVYGIEPEAQLDPEDPLAFVTGVTFREAGPVSITQSPFTQDYIAPQVPEAGAVAMMLAGLAVVAAYGRRARPQNKK